MRNEDRMTIVCAEITGVRSPLPWQAEYDTVAIALQNRLDGKEYKSREISDSFREFKREVLRVNAT